MNPFPFPSSVPRWLSRTLLVSALGALLLAAPPSILADDAPSHFPQSVASGEPRPNSVVLWTRALDPAAPGQSQTVSVQVATDREFTQVVKTVSELPARAADDHCLKVLVEGLEPATVYYYRFSLAGGHQSPVGRTKTAPAAGGDAPVKFAFLTCQDYVGRYYNTLRDMMQRHPDLDFIVYLGDYIYETTGDPQFQQSNPGRDIVFTDQAGAIPLGQGENTYYAAASLSNYRQLYQTYKSDPVLRELHENFPVVIIWDDHEFTDDHWQAHSTYFDGRQPELSEARKLNAERAYFEYLPVPNGATPGGLVLGDGDFYPNTSVYRALDFGSNLRLFLTDYRTFRPDHLIAEDAFPGTIVMDQTAVQATLQAALGLDSATLAVLWDASLKHSFDPYLDLDDPTWATLRAGLGQIITGAYLAEGLLPADAAARATAAVTGRQSVDYLNNAFLAAGLAAPIDEATRGALPRGLSHLYLGKTGLFSQVGSRYFVVRASFQLYAAYRAAVDARTQDAFGPAQTAWLQQTLGASPAAWNILGSSVSFCPIGIDFSDSPIPLPTEFPATFRQNFQLNADHWDGFPNARSSVIDLLSTKNSLIVSGDIHASFVSTYTSAASSRRVAEFTGSSVSSETFQEIARGLALPLFGDLPGIDQLVSLLDVFVYDAVGESPDTHLHYANTRDNGYVVLEILDGGQARAEVRTLSIDHVFEDLTDPSQDALRPWLFDTRGYTVRIADDGPQVDTWPVPQMREDPLSGLQTGWFGALNPAYQPWIWHAQHGWLYVVPAPFEFGGILAFAEGLGWLYTHPEIYPNLYDFGPGRWLFYSGTTSPRWFWDYRAGQWISQP